MLPFETIVPSHSPTPCVSKFPAKMVFWKVKVAPASSLLCTPPPTPMPFKAALDWLSVIVLLNELTVPEKL